MGNYWRLVVIFVCVLGALAAFVGTVGQSAAGPALLQLGMVVSLLVVAYFVLQGVLERYRDEEGEATARVEELQRSREGRGRRRL